MRKRIWFKVLDNLERGILNLTIGLVEDVKSLTLSRVLMGIVKKLIMLTESPFMRHVKGYGFARLANIVGFAKGFGSVVADDWLRDEMFPKLLAINNLNNLAGWKIIG